MNGYERALDAIEATYRSATRKLAQPAMDLVHRWNGPAYHRISSWCYALALLAFAAMVSSELHYQLAWATPKGRFELTLWFLPSLAMGCALAACLLHERAFSRRAARDPFIAFDPAYRRRPTSAFIAALTACTALDTPTHVAGLVHVVTSVEASGLPWTHPFVVGALSLSGASTLHAAAWLVALLSGGCERPRSGRRRSGREHAGARGTDAREATS